MNPVLISPQASAELLSSAPNNAIGFKPFQPGINRFYSVNELHAARHAFIHGACR